jgi:hypothetical protein
MQKEAPRLSAAPQAWMSELQGRIEMLGLPVRLSI